MLYNKSMLKRVFVLMIVIFLLMGVSYPTTLRAYVIGPYGKILSGSGEIRLKIIKAIVKKMNQYLKDKDLEISIDGTVGEERNWELMLDKGEIDAVIGVVYRRKYKDYIIELPILSGRYALFSRREESQTKIVGVLKVYKGYASAIPANLKVYSSLREEFKDFCSKKIDGLFLRYEDFYTVKNYSDCYKAIKYRKLYGRYWLFIAVRKDLNDEVKDLLRKALMRMYKDDAMENEIKSSNLENAYIAPNHLTFAVINYPPYMIYNNGNAKGTDVDLIRCVSKRLGIKVKITSYPPKRIFLALKFGLVDGAFSMEKTPQRESFLIFAKEPLSYGKDVLFYTKRDFDWKNLNGKKVTIVEGYTGEEILKKMGAEVIKVKDDESGIRMLIYGKSDAHFTNLLAGLYYINLIRTSKKIFRSPSLREYFSYLAFPESEDYIPFENMYSMAIRNVKNSEEYSKILEKYNVTFKLMWKR